MALQHEQLTKTEEPATFSISYAEDGYVLGYHRNLVIAVWGKKASSPVVAELGRVSDEVAKRYARISGIHLIVNRAGVPDPQVRQEFATMTDEYASRLACLAIMVDGKGFWASAMRSFLTGLHFLRPSTYRTRICATPQEAAQWVPIPHNTGTSVCVTPHQLTGVLDQALGHPAVRPGN